MKKDYTINDALRSLTPLTDMRNNVAQYRCMKIMNFKYIEFRVAEQKPKTTVWDILNKNSGDRIGQVKWWSNWRQYCFLPDEECVFSASCLQDIITFIQTEMSKRKNTGVAE